MVPFLMLEIAKKKGFTKMSEEKKRKITLTIAEKSGIVDLAEKNKSLSSARLGFDFTAKFSRPIHIYNDNWNFETSYNVFELDFFV